MTEQSATPGNNDRLSTGWLTVLFMICGPLNPALLIAGFLGEIDVPGLHLDILDFSIRTLRNRLPFVIGPSVLMTLIALHRLRRLAKLDHAAMTAAWWRGYWVSVLAAPFCFGVFMGVFGAVTHPTDMLELLMMVPLVSVVGLVVGWLTLIIPFMAVVVGLPALLFSIFATRACARLANGVGRRAGNAA